jgi:uncharacterized protein (TIGR03435 family)
MRRGTIVLLTSLLCISLATAQRPSFEVASVKRFDASTSGQPNFSGFQDQPGGRFIVSGVTLKMLITYAYRVRDFQFVGGPDWMNTDQWEVIAKAEEGSVPSHRGKAFDPREQDTVALMVQSLLEDRFQLKIHRETRELPVYDLLQGKDGAKLQLSADQSPPQPAPPGEESSPQNGRRTPPRGNVLMFAGPTGLVLLGNAVTLTVLGDSLTFPLGRAVLNHTNLKDGLYDFKLQWKPDVAELGKSAPGGYDGTSPADPAAVSIFTAVQEQLGLRLVSSKGPVEVLVIDSVQKPVANGF